MISAPGRGGEVDFEVKAIFFNGLCGNPGMRVDAPDWGEVYYFVELIEEM